MIAFDSGPAAGDRLDTCGTGGDGAETVNVSTAAAIVVAACGVRVVKHGNRAATGRSGSSDVLGSAGRGRRCRTSVLRHGASTSWASPSCSRRGSIPGLRGVAAVRRQLPFRTIFNLVGPLCNPASPTHQLVGVPGDDQARLMAEVLARADSIRRAVVVTGGDGLDEVTLDGPTRVRVDRAGDDSRTGLEPRRLRSAARTRQRAADLRARGKRRSSATDARGRPGPGTGDRAGQRGGGPLDDQSRSPSRAVDRAARAIDSEAAARLVERWSELTREGR